ncbi:MAG TPA: aminotransferase class I/II-fold pyridoxal phosphate-dependent enzyme [Ktedonobacteraceae bacterium]|nr:aminotransferase class I/II-fold pyridoxal phosphate-dependent enzyme [Ktedonobacteraceae bacterium]
MHDSQQQHALNAQTHTSIPLALTPSLQDMASSPTLAINEAVAARRAAGHTIIHLGFGEASFPLHPLLGEAIARSAKRTGYAPVAGIPSLRQAIAAYLHRTRHITFTPDNIVVAPGSKPLLYALLQVLDGDLLLPVPSWVSYAPQAQLAGRRVIAVETDASDNQRLTSQALSDAVARARFEGADPRILIVNTPSNPTGSMFSREGAQAIANWSREHGITLISDEIYAELAHGWREHISPAQFYPEGCIVTGGLSKAFSAGGWRLGYAAIPDNAAGKQLVASARALASEIWSSAATPVQEAAVVAYSPNAELTAYVQASARIHAYATARLYETLTNLGALCPRPAGGFYLYPDLSPWREALLARNIATSEQLAMHLLDQWDIATLPGTAFCEQPQELRLRLATSMLYMPPEAKTEEEREAALWQLLAQAERWTDDGQANIVVKMPALKKAQVRLTEFIASLGQPIN